MASLLVLASCLLQAVRALGASTVTSKDGVQYYVPHVEVANIKDVSEKNNLTPFVVVSAKSSCGAPKSIELQLSHFESVDDVYSDFFSNLVYVQGADARGDEIKHLHGATIMRSSHHPLSTHLSPGPYFLSCTGAVYKAYRLYDDPQSAFTAGLLQVSDDSFEPISASSYSAQAEAAIAVPSRLYYPSATEEKPLSGVRVAVKDIYHVKGVKTGAASRNFFKLYPPRNESADAVQKLIDLGAVIVAKAKTSQFANGENPTADWVEVIAPFNPRGDGWQYCSSSSAGSAVSIASYDWLDAAIGTDTSGSMRFPAAYNGVFAGRQSHGGISTDGVIPASPSLDTLGVFTRSALTHRTFLKSWYGKYRYETYETFPKKIYRVTNATTGGFPVTATEAQDLYDGFIDKLAAFLDASVSDLEPSVAWAKTGPVNEELLVYTNMSYLAIAFKDQVELVRTPFFNDWKDFTGQDKMPTIGPKAHASYDYGMNNVTDARYAESVAIKANFTKWWSEEVNPLNKETCSEALFVYPTGSKGSPTYRDTYLSPPNVVVEWSVSQAAVYAGLPDYAVPIGQVSYSSRLTGVNETLPVSISIGAGRGCDYMLADLLVKLEESGLTSSVKTGVTAF